MRIIRATARPHRRLSLEKEPRKLEGGIEVLPWRVFVERLWGSDLTR